MEKSNFETNMESLEKIVTELEKGDLNLDESISKFEDGIKISKECNKILEEAEKKITILLQEDGNIKEDFANNKYELVEGKDTMNNFMGFIQNKCIYVPIIMWFCIQSFKVIYDLITTKKFNFKRIMGAGGMPSSHSAVVTSVATVIGKYEGVDTPIFALALIMAFVVMYDACGVRRAAGKQAALLNKIIETPGLTGVQVSEKLVEVLGHTPIQVFVGALLGVIAGLIA